jgi:hypothetical protein
MKKQLLHYWEAMTATAIQSAAAAGAAWLGTAGAHALDDSTPAMGLKAMAGTLAVAFFGSVMNYLAKNPLPISEAQQTALDDQKPISPAIPPADKEKDKTK